MIRPQPSRLASPRLALLDCSTADTPSLASTSIPFHSRPTTNPAAALLPRPFPPALPSAPTRALFRQRTATATATAISSLHNSNASPIPPSPCSSCLPTPTHLNILPVLHTSRHNSLPSPSYFLCPLPLPVFGWDHLSRMFPARRQSERWRSWSQLHVRSPWGGCSLITWSLPSLTRSRPATARGNWNERDAVRSSGWATRVSGRRRREGVDGRTGRISSWRLAVTRRRKGCVRRMLGLCFASFCFRFRSVFGSCS